MKRFFLFYLLFLSSFAVTAQPSWVKKASKSVFTLKTFDAEGTLLGSANGFFTSEQGDALSSFAPFRGAVRGVVIDASGKEYPVACMLGANETYDVAKFRVDVKKAQPLTIAPQKQPQGVMAWLLPYREVKKVPEGQIRQVETIADEYGYYTLAMSMPESAVSAPLLNEAGEVIGLMQRPFDANDSLCYAVSARFADSLKMTGLSINDPALRATHIKKALPADEAQALLTLYVGSSTLDSLGYVELVEDFVKQFPNSQEGYVYRAQLAANANDYAGADADLAQALKVGSKPDEVHFSYSRMVYQKVLYRKEPAYEPWTLDKAMNEALEAYAINPLPAYRQQQAYILYAQQKYDDASAIYEQLFSTPLRSAELFYEASRCREMACDTLGQLALLDSVVATFSKPYLKEAAPYILVRAQLRQQMGKYRDAVNDYNDYEQLMKTQVNDNFYYVRHQAEVGGRLFQQALNDLNTAITMNPQYELYYAEKASLELRVGLYDDVIATANQCIALAPAYSDGYLFLGLAQCMKGQKVEGAKNLQKARELGDEQAEALIEKYAK